MRVAARPNFSSGQARAAMRDNTNLLDFHAGLSGWRTPDPRRCLVLDYKVVRLEAAANGLLYEAVCKPRLGTARCETPGRHIADAPEVPHQKTQQIARDLWPRSVRHPVTSPKLEPFPGLRARPNFKRAIPPLLVRGLREAPAVPPTAGAFFASSRRCDPSFRAGEQPQRRLLAAHETGIPKPVAAICRAMAHDARMLLPVGHGDQLRGRGCTRRYAD
jgi:hypothetical protein